jgi:hypothetical protein
MPDPRHFAKLDLGYFDNPKIAGFLDDRPRVMILHLRAITYCRQHLTDGRFPVRLVVRLACASYCGSHCDGQCDYCAAEHAGLFVRDGDRDALVHDYLEHQDSADQVRARKTAGQSGAAARWGGKSNAKGNADRNADRIPKGNADANAEKRREEKIDPGFERPDVIRLCDHLASRIASNGAKRPNVGKSWIKDARLLLDADSRSEDEAHALIDWCQDSTFWRSNILSMSKFREKYDQLRLQADTGIQTASLPRNYRYFDEETA